MCICGVGACCASICASCCTHCCCSALKDCNAKKGPASRIPYVFLMFLVCIFAVIMSLYGEKELYSNNMFDTSLRACNSQGCKGNGAVYRSSFALFLFFGIHVLVLGCGAVSFHWLFLSFKLLIFFIFLIASFWFPSDLYSGYAEFARIASIFFLLMQVLILINWGYDLNERLVGQIEENEQKVDDTEEDEEMKDKCKGCAAKFALIGGTLFIYACCITFWIFFYSWFGSKKTGVCETNKTLISITIILCIIIAMTSLCSKDGSVFTAAVVSGYVTYLCYAGLESYPRAECNAFVSKGKTTSSKNSASLWVGVLITAAAISYAGFNASNSSLLHSDNDDNSDEIDMELKTVVTKKEKKTETTEEGGDDDDDDNDDGETNNKSNYDDVDDDIKTKEPSHDKTSAEHKANIRFHVCMLMASIYVSMLYTNWSTDAGSKARAQGRGQTSLWVQITAQYVTFIIYLWTLVAPLLCPDRFGKSTSDDDDDE